MKNKWLTAIIIIALLWLLSNVLAGVLGLFLVSEETVMFSKGNIAVIPVKGIISVEKNDNLLDRLVVSSDKLVKFIKTADEEPSIQAILLDINSPGGSPVATDEIAQAVKSAEKPVFAVIREVGASGAYWIASAADYVMANRMSVTGSIGVISSYLELTGLMEKYGVYYERLVAGQYKDIGTPFRNLTSEERVMFRKTLDSLHGFFIDEVAANRNLSDEEAEKISSGMFYLGVEAKELKLVDALGSKDDMIKHIEKELNITAEIVEVKEKKSFLEALSQVFSRQSFNVGEGIGSSLVSKSQGNGLPVRV